MIPKKIYIGLNCKPEYKDMLESIGKEFGGYCQVYQMELERDSSNFDLRKVLLNKRDCNNCPIYL